MTPCIALYHRPADAIPAVLRDQLEDSTDDETQSAVPHPRNSGDQTTGAQASSGGRGGGGGGGGRWRCCTSGRAPPPITEEAVEDAEIETQLAVAADAPAADALSRDGTMTMSESSKEAQAQQEVRQVPAPHGKCCACRGCCSSSARWEAGDGGQGELAEEDSLMLQERQIEAAGGLQRLGSGHLVNMRDDDDDDDGDGDEEEENSGGGGDAAAAAPTSTTPSAAVAPTPLWGPDSDSDDEPGAGAGAGAGAEQGVAAGRGVGGGVGDPAVEEGMNPPLHRRTSSGVIKM